MVHPILEPIIDQLPVNAVSRSMLEQNLNYSDINIQLSQEQKWCRQPELKDNKNITGRDHLHKNGYSDWLKNAEEEDFIRMVGLLQLILETYSSLEEDSDES